MIYYTSELTRRRVIGSITDVSLCILMCLDALWNADHFSRIKNLLER